MHFNFNFRGSFVFKGILGNFQLLNGILQILSTHDAADVSEIDGPHVRASGAAQLYA